MTRAEYIAAILAAIEGELLEMAIPTGGELPERISVNLEYKNAISSHRFKMISAENPAGEREDKIAKLLARADDLQKRIKEKLGDQKDNTPESE